MDMGCGVGNCQRRKKEGYWNGVVQRDCAIRGSHPKIQLPKSGKLSNSRESALEAAWEQSALYSESAELWRTQ